jgi:hypothetical protein
LISIFFQIDNGSGQFLDSICNATSSSLTVLADVLYIQVRLQPGGQISTSVSLSSDNTTITTPGKNIIPSASTSPTDDSSTQIISTSTSFPTSTKPNEKG